MSSLKSEMSKTSKPSMIRKSRKPRPKEMKLKRKWTNLRLNTINKLTCTKINKIFSDISSTFKKKSTTRENANKKTKNGKRKRKQNRPNKRNNLKTDKRRESKERNKMKRESNVTKKENLNFRLKNKVSSIEIPTGNQSSSVSS